MFVTAAIAAAWRPGSIAIGTTIFQLGIMTVMFGVLSHSAAAVSQIYEAGEERGRQLEREEHVCARVVRLRGAKADGEFERRRDLSSA